MWRPELDTILQLRPNQRGVEWKNYFSSHSSLELLSNPPTAASQAAGITGTRHHTGPLLVVTPLIFIELGDKQSCISKDTLGMEINSFTWLIYEDIVLNIISFI
uniref:Uncharacterized protein n=1 Tax=Chelydra serpentina TaxID=8475 RepID=A0A8C3S7M0_CHESE